MEKKGKRKLTRYRTIHDSSYISVFRNIEIYIWKPDFWSVISPISLGHVCVRVCVYTYVCMLVRVWEHIHSQQTADNDATR